MNNAIYVKDEGKWEKDSGDKAAKDIRTKIKDKSIMAMKEWEDANQHFQIIQSWRKNIIK